jgi:hypothetical protein
MFLKEKLARGPCPANIIDDAVEVGRLRAPSVEKAKAELGLVARGINNGQGAVVHLCRRTRRRRLRRKEGRASQGVPIEEPRESPRWIDRLRRPIIKGRGQFRVSSTAGRRSLS